MPTEDRTDLLQVHDGAHVGVVGRPRAPVARVHAAVRGGAGAWVWCGDSLTVGVEGEHDLLPRAGRAGDGEFLGVDLPRRLREQMVTLGHELAEGAVLRTDGGAILTPPLVELLGAVVVLRQVVGVARASDGARGGTG